jgi:hypothetical protein
VFAAHDRRLQLDGATAKAARVYQMARAGRLNKEDGSSIIKVFERMAGVTIGDDD